MVYCVFSQRVLFLPVTIFFHPLDVVAFLGRSRRLIYLSFDKAAFSGTEYIPQQSVEWLQFFSRDKRRYPLFLFWNDLVHKVSILAVLGFFLLATISHPSCLSLLAARDWLDRVTAFFGKKRQLY